MTGAAIAAAASLAASLIGGSQSAKAAREAKAKTEALKQENEDWYNRRYYEDPTQRADAQRILTKTREMLRKQNEAAAGQQAVNGGTEAAVAAQKEASAQALADAASQIAVNGERRKDEIEESYRTTGRAIDKSLIDLENQRAQNIAKATSGVISSAGSLAGSAIGDVTGAAKSGNAGTTGTATKVTPVENAESLWDQEEEKDYNHTDKGYYNGY